MIFVPCETMNLCRSKIPAIIIYNIIVLRSVLCWHQGPQLLLFENYGYLHRPQDSILKAIERVNWMEYNLPLEVPYCQSSRCMCSKRWV